MFEFEQKEDEYEDEENVTLEDSDDDEQDVAAVFGDQSVDTKKDTTKRKVRAGWNKCDFSRISRFRERIQTEHIDRNSRLKSQLHFDSIHSIRVRAGS